MVSSAAHLCLSPPLLHPAVRSDQGTLCLLTQPSQGTPNISNCLQSLLVVMVTIILKMSAQLQEYKRDPVYKQQSQHKESHWLLLMSLSLKTKACPNSQNVYEVIFTYAHQPSTSPLSSLPSSPVTGNICLLTWADQGAEMGQGD